MPPKMSGPVASNANAVHGFLPSQSGLHFANRFESGPTVKLGFLDPRWVGVGDASAGLCGGMCWFVRERFETGVRPPGDRSAPANGSPLFQAIVRRQVLSLDWLRGPVRFWLGGLGGASRAARRTVETEWPKAKAAIDTGHLPMLGLIRHTGPNPFALTQDHQVLAYGYDTDATTGTTTIHLYDPNWPDRDDVTLTLGPDGIHQSTGEPLMGFFDQG
jgi:hypothetical protein